MIEHRAQSLELADSPLVKMSVSGVLRGLPAEGVGRDLGSGAGEGFPLPMID